MSWTTASSTTAVSNTYITYWWGPDGVKHDNSPAYKWTKKKDKTPKEYIPEELWDIENW